MLFAKKLVTYFLQGTSISKLFGNSTSFHWSIFVSYCHVLRNDGTKIYCAIDLRKYKVDFFPDIPVLSAVGKVLDAKISLDAVVSFLFDAQVWFLLTTSRNPNVRFSITHDKIF